MLTINLIEYIISFFFEFFYLYDDTKFFFNLFIGLLLNLILKGLKI